MRLDESFRLVFDEVLRKLRPYAVDALKTVFRSFLRGPIKSRQLIIALITVLYVCDCLEVAKSLLFVSSLFVTHVSKGCILQAHFQSLVVPVFLMGFLVFAADVCFLLSFPCF